MRHLDDVTSADTGRRRTEIISSVKSPFAKPQTQLAPSRQRCTAGVSLLVAGGCVVRVAIAWLCKRTRSRTIPTDSMGPAPVATPRPKAASTEQAAPPSGIKLSIPRTREFGDLASWLVARQAR